MSNGHQRIIIIIIIIICLYNFTNTDHIETAKRGTCYAPDAFLELVLKLWLDGRVQGLNSHHLGLGHGASTE